MLSLPQKKNCDNLPEPKPCNQDVLSKLAQIEVEEREEEDEEEDEVTELDSDTPPHAAKNNVAKAVKVRALLVFIFLLFTLFDNNGHLGSN
jgi:hypothetical protein